MLAIAYLAWMASNLYRVTEAMGATLKRGALELPIATRFLVVNHGWLYLSLFLVPTLVVVWAAGTIKRNERALLVTLVVVLAARVVADWIVTLYFIPVMSPVEELR